MIYGWNNLLEKQHTVYRSQCSFHPWCVIRSKRPPGEIQFLISTYQGENILVWLRGSCLSEVVKQRTTPSVFFFPPSLSYWRLCSGFETLLLLLIYLSTILLQYVFRHNKCAELSWTLFSCFSTRETLVRSKSVIVKTEDGTGKGIDKGLVGSVSLGSLVEIQSSHQCKWKRLWTYNCNFRGCDEHNRRRATAFPRLSPSNFPSA